MTRRIRPLRSSFLLLALLVPSCDDGDDSAASDGSNDSAASDDSDASAASDEMAAPLPDSRAELDALADQGVIVRSTPESIESANRDFAERLRVAELRVRTAASQEHGERLAAVIAPARGVERTKDGNYRVKLVDAELGEREIITMGPAATTLDLAAALDALDSPTNQLAAYRALHENISPTTRKRLGAASPDSLVSARASEIRAEIERLTADPELLGSLVMPGAPEPQPQPQPTADNSGGSCSPSPATGVVANFSFGLKPNLTSVKNQGTRGSCVAFAVTSAVETARSVSGGGLANFSEQDLYYRGKAEWFGLQNYTEGLNVGDTLNMAVSQNYRLANETSWPYNPSPSRLDLGTVYVNSCTGYTFSPGGVISNYCSDTAHQGGQFSLGNTSFYSSPIGSGTGSKVSATFDIPVSVPQIKAYLTLKKSLVMSFNVPASFKNSPGGYVNASVLDSPIGAHAIHVVGTIDNTQLATVRPGAPAGSGGGYLILKNSWGSCFGDGGFYYMSYNTMTAFGYAIRVVDVVN